MGFHSDAGIKGKYVSQGSHHMVVTGFGYNNIVSYFLFIVVIAYNQNHLCMLFFSCNEEMNLKDTPLLVPSSTSLFPQTSSNINSSPCSVKLLNGPLANLFLL